MNREKKDLGPTPTLAVERLRGKQFTYSENQLLDQITFEITEAWAKDLKVIRKTYEELKEASGSIIKSNNMFTQLLDNLERMSEETAGVSLLSVMQMINEVHEFTHQVRKELFDFKQSYKSEEIMKIKEELVKINDHLKEVGKKRKWWRFW